ncbi:MAG: DnaJ domain-containing protein [Chloroflexi bacterium]|nr:DnaJ domain-containing protein [Chloroflexota bacterium]MBI1854611.1 DnaJ domain-containing protein [Chloroflexota bacterium]MBI3339143.1 DnaJ domain-containing protein [Chloroflexota bacterium]
MPQDQRDYYALLGILREASSEEIKRAYYEAAQRLHPDKNKLAGETEIFLEVQQAYEVLSNPKRRAQYDATLSKQETESPFIKHKLLYSRANLVHLDETQLIYVLMEIGPRDTNQKIPAPPLNICLVLDRSTSMQGDNIDVAKTATTQLMRSLRPEDIFSVVAFSDRAEVLIPAAYQSQNERTKLQSRIQMLQTGGATEIYQGLKAGFEEVRRGLDPKRINHIILLTDGQTYGDEQACLQLAEEAAQLNIGISGMGIGGEWNDIFLDALASRTGNNSSYISKSQDIQRLLIEKFNDLGNMFAEDVLLDFKKQDDIQINYAFRLHPEGGPISLENPLHLGPILQDTSLNVLFEFMVQPSASKADLVTLLDGSLKIIASARPTSIPPIRIKLEREAGATAKADPPPPVILSALARLTLYRLQERARQEASAGEYEQATRHLKNLAVHLLSQGEKSLAKTALLQAEQMERTQSFSRESGKEIKYGTRALLFSATEE